ncbi:hypothetical protein TNCV_1104491 [Trichonephila clavipes]|nr:hypothetical protein TNCV_1104491 [Trichonephila clavipes]
MFQILLWSPWKYRCGQRTVRLAVVACSQKQRSLRAQAHQTYPRLLAANLVLLNYGQVTKTTPEMAHSYLTSTSRQWGGLRATTDLGLHTVNLHWQYDSKSRLDSAGHEFASMTTRLPQP